MESDDDEAENTALLSEIRRVEGNVPSTNGQHRRKLEMAPMSSVQEEADGVPQHLYVMTPRDVHRLLRHERYLMSEEQAASAREVEPILRERGADTGRLILDPCLGYWDFFWAKASLCSVLLCGVLLTCLVAHLTHRWLQQHAMSGSVPPVEATLVAVILIPSVLAAFLCLLEHAEWKFVRKVAPQSQLPYTPVLHGLGPRLRRLWCRVDA